MQIKNNLHYKEIHFHGSGPKGFITFFLGLHLQLKSLYRSLHFCGSELVKALSHYVVKQPKYG